MNTAQTSRNVSTAYIPGLDGLRAIAVTMVILFHYSSQFPSAFTSSTVLSAIFKTLSIGWAGVDVFFVISGYLIATILEHRPITTTREYGRFIKRRAKRLLPAYLACVIICLALASTVITDEKLVENQYLLWTMTSNILSLIDQRSALWGANITLAHFWSLAAEWQFYIIFPIAMMLVHDKRLLFLAAVIIAIFTRISLIHYHPQNFDNVIYSSIFTRIDSLAAGVLLSTAPKLISNRARSAIGICGLSTLLVLLTCIATTDGPFKLIPWVQTFGYTLIAASFAMILYYIINADDNCSAIRFLESYVLRIVGRASYSLYIWHLPFYPLIIAVVKSNYSDTMTQFMVASMTGLFFTALAGVTSYQLLEKRFMYARPDVDISKRFART